MQIPKIWEEIGEYARYTPTPHNTQPLRLKVIDNKQAEVFYDLTRALPEGDPPARFALTAIGLFVEAIKIAAASKGYRLEYTYETQALHNAALKGLQKVAHLRLIADQSIVDVPAELLIKRRTNRLPYNRRPISAAHVKQIAAVAQDFGHSFHVREDTATVNWVTRLNRRMVFYDLDEDNVRRELAGWSRFTRKQAHRTKDGLSAECLHVPGWGLWLFMKHYGLLHIPGLRQLLRWIYWQNMQGITTIAWLEGPFVTHEDYLRSGHVLLRVWLKMAELGVSYHPFGSVITNQRAHAEFVEHLHINEQDTMAWLLMRIGYSNTEPPRSERLPLEEYFI